MALGVAIVSDSRIMLPCKRLDTEEVHDKLLVVSNLSYGLTRSPLSLYSMRIRRLNLSFAVSFGNCLKWVKAPRYMPALKNLRPGLFLASTMRVAPAISPSTNFVPSQTGKDEYCV